MVQRRPKNAHLFIVFSSLSGLFLGVSFRGWHAVDWDGKGRSTATERRTPSAALHRMTFSSAQKSINSAAGNAEARFRLNHFPLNG